MSIWATSNEIMHSMNAGDTGTDRWWQKVLALGTLPETRDQSETAPKSSAPVAFIVTP